MKVMHTLEPIYDNNSKILILGTIPSLKSRELGFYYGHPQNRFWKVMSDVLNEELPDTIEKKKQFLYRNKIALWDVLASCDIKGSSDSSIKNPVVNNISKLLINTKIKAIFVTGRKALELYNRFCFDGTKIRGIYLPSTSPANNAVSYKNLKKSYELILEYLEGEF